MGAICSILSTLFLMVCRRLYSSSHVSSIHFAHNNPFLTLCVDVTSGSMLSMRANVSTRTSIGNHILPVIDRGLYFCCILFGKCGPGFTPAHFTVSRSHMVTHYTFPPNLTSFFSLFCTINIQILSQHCLRYLVTRCSSRYCLSYIPFGHDMAIGGCKKLCSCCSASE